MFGGVTGIICALDSELELYRAHLHDMQEKNGFLLGRIGSSRVVLGLCGPGKVNAAVCTQSMLLLFKPDRVLNTGIAGAIAPDLQTLDTVIASSVCQHDMDTSPIGDPVGEIPGTGRVFLPCDEELIHSLLSCAKELSIPSRTGIIASGDQFLADPERKRAIRDTFQADCGEMESGAIGHVCFLAHVPFAAVRVISDSCDGSAAMSYTHLKERASHLSSRLLLQLL